MEQCCSDIRSAVHIVIYVFGVSIMFEQTISGSPSLEAMATAKAALDVVDGKVPLSRCFSSSYFQKPRQRARSSALLNSYHWHAYARVVCWS